MDGAFCAERKEACDNRLNDLRKLMCTLYEAQEKAFNQSKSEQDRAITLARAEMERRLEGMNEFRDQLTRQANTFMDTKVYQADQKTMLEEVRILREWKSRSDGERSRTVIISWIAVVISLISTGVVVLQGVK